MQHPFKIGGHRAERGAGGTALLAYEPITVAAFDSTDNGLVDDGRIVRIEVDRDEPHPVLLIPSFTRRGHGQRRGDSLERLNHAPLAAHGGCADISVGRPATCCSSLVDPMSTHEPTRYDAIAPEPTGSTALYCSRIGSPARERTTRGAPLPVRWNAPRTIHSGNTEQRHRRRIIAQLTGISRSMRSHPPAAGVSSARRSRRV